MRDRPLPQCSVAGEPPLKDVEMRLPPLLGQREDARKILDGKPTHAEHEIDLRAVRSASAKQHPFYPLNAAASSCRRCITSIIPQYLFNEVLSYLPVYPELLKLCLTSKNFARISHSARVYRPQCGKCERCVNNSEVHCLQPQYRLPASAVPMLLKHSCETLQVLVLAGTTDLEDGHLVPALPKLQQLRVLDLSMCRNLTDHTALSVAEHLKSLVALSFRDVNNLTDHGLSAVAASCRQLEALVLLGCDKVTDVTITVLAAHARALRVLNVWGCHHLSDESMLALARYQVNLLELNVRYCHRLSGPALQAVARQSIQLKHLNARYMMKLTDDSALELVKSCPELLTLNLSQCERLTDATMLAVARMCPKIVELRLWRCRGISLEGVMALVEGCPDLRVLDIRETSALDHGNQGISILDVLNRSPSGKCWRPVEVNNQPGVFVAADYAYRPSKQSVQLPEYSVLV